MGEESTFALTLVRVGPFLPYVEVAAYEYLASHLPEVGDTITVNRIAGPDAATQDVVSAYVTRVDGNAKPPLMATEVKATGQRKLERLGGHMPRRTGKGSSSLAKG